MSDTLTPDEVNAEVLALREAVRGEHAEAIDALVTPIEDALAEALARVWHRAMTRAGALVAAVDPNGLGPIGREWADEVSQITPIIGEVYETGALATWQQHSGAHALADGDPALNPQEVVDAGAVDRARQAQNRMVGIGDDAWADARETIARGIDEGWDVEQTSKALEDRLEVHQSRARTVARTETVAAANAGSLDGVRALGRYGPRIKEWMASMDSRTRDSHYLADGQTRARDMPFNVGGSALQYPGDPAGPARETVNCRCTILWVESGTEVLPEPDTDAPPTPRPVEDLTPPPPPSAPDPPPQVITPEEAFARDINDARADFRRKAHDGAGNRAAVRADDSESGLGALEWDDLHVEVPTGDRARQASSLLEELEEASTDIGRRVDDEITRRLASRGIEPGRPLTAREADALQDAVRREFEVQSQIDARIMREMRREGLDPEGIDIPTLQRRVEADPEFIASKARARAALDEMNSGVSGIDPLRYRDEYAAELRQIIAEVRPTRSVNRAAFDLPQTDFPQGVRRQLVADVAEAYPQSWLSRSLDFGPMDLIRDTRERMAAYYTPTSPGRRATIGLDWKKPSAWLRETGIHEFGHRMENVVPGLRQLEYAFYNRRVGAETQKRLADVARGAGYGPFEHTRPDRFADPYSGKAYGDDAFSDWELFTMGAQTYLSPEVYGPTWQQFGRKMMDDDDYRRWFVGVLMVAG